MAAAQAVGVSGGGRLSPDLLYLAATVLIWVGFGALFVAVLRGLESLSSPAGPARALTVRSAIFAALTAGLCLFVGTAIPKTPGSADAFSANALLKLPIVWPIMPFAGWCAVVGICAAGYQLFRASVEGSIGFAKPGQRRLFAVCWLAFALAGYGVLRWSHDDVTLVRGVIPISATGAAALLALAAAALGIMVLAGRAVRFRNTGGKLVAHVVLLAGCVVFGLPMLWALVTSFKEDDDIVSVNGLAWVPKRQVTVPYRDPKDPRYEFKFEGQTVQALVIEKLPDGQLKMDIQRPQMYRGRTAVRPLSELKEVAQNIPVVFGNYQGNRITGRVIKENEDGSRVVQVTDPPAEAGQVFTAKANEVENYRVPGLRWENYPESLEYLPPESHSGLVFLKNTVLLALLGIAGTLLSSSLVAYAFARVKFPARGALFMVVVSTMMLPAAVTLMPTFLIFRQLGWIDTLYPLWVPAFFGSAFNIFLLRQFFSTIPSELEDASKIDGCGYLKTYWSVMLPQIKPALAVIAIWTFLGVWNNFMGPLIYINSPENMPISYALQLYASDRSSEPELLMAFAMLTMIPVLALFFTAQKYFFEGVTLTGLGGR
ncbi:MAG: carbohydrate ABC transporter permease [Armatimonadetes bacterium]|nr:carbohydrate ABC transporter permease [Armatimonadota bacterium]